MGRDSASLDGLGVDVYRGVDGKLVVDIIGPGDEKDMLPDTSPDIRVWINEALIYSNGEVGDNLPWSPPPDPDTMETNHD